MTIITVKPGDTIYSISNEYNVPQFVLVSDNALETQSVLVVGQSLIIRNPEEIYTATSDTTVFDVADLFSVSPDKIFRNNLFLNGRNFLAKDTSIVITFRDLPTLSKIIGGYAYDFIAKPLLNTVTPFLTYIMPFTYGFNSDGSLIAPDDEPIIRAGQKYGARPILHLSTLTPDGTFSSTNATALLSDRILWEVLINNLLETVNQNGYYGVDVDFEYLQMADASAYVDFVSELTQRLNAQGLICIVALVPKTSDTQTGLLYEGIDYSGLGQSANYVLVMTYEWGYRFGPAMAIAPIPSVRRVLDYTVSRIPPEKVLLGISNYGYDWTLPFVRGESDAPSISNREALELAIKYNAVIQFNETSKAPFFFYTDEIGRNHEVWFEDARSFAEKVSLIEEYSLAGGFIWDLMRENNQGFATLDSLIDIQKL